MFYTDEEHGYDIYGKEMRLTFKKDVYPVVKRIQEDVRQNYPEELKDEYVQDFMNLTAYDWMGNERYIAECMTNIENRLNDRGMSLDDPNLIEDSVKEFVEMEWEVDFSKM
jgi:transcriptional regulator with PAS, ATPase and Fis domain